LSSIDQQDEAASGIGAARIDPSAETTNLQPANGVTPQQEVDFYKRAGSEYRLAHNQQNLGWLGLAFGSSASAPTNIAGLVVVLCLLFYGLSFFATGSGELASARAGALGLVGTALGYIFGSASKNSPS
jgi:hypothetical protein